MSKAFQSHECSLQKGLRDISEPRDVIFLCIVLFLGTAAPQGPSEAAAHPWHHSNPSSRARDAQEGWSYSGLTAGKGHQVPSVPGISRDGEGASRALGGVQGEAPQDLSELLTAAGGWMVAGQKMGFLWWQTRQGIHSPVKSAHI